jgi:hypothetical protein
MPSSSRARSPPLTSTKANNSRTLKSRSSTAAAIALSNAAESISMIRPVPLQWGHSWDRVMKVPYREPHDVADRRPQHAVLLRRPLHRRRALGSCDAR